MNESVFDTYARQDGRFNQSGFRINGFAAGDYTLYYIIGASGGTTPNSNTEGIHIGVGGTDAEDVGSFDLTGKTLYTYDNFNNDLANWSAHDGSADSANWNYITQTITLSGTDQWIEIIHDQSNGTGNRNGAAALQLVLIPEPSTFALVGLAGVALVTFRRRRR